MLIDRELDRTVQNSRVYEPESIPLALFNREHGSRSSERLIPLIVDIDQDPFPIDQYRPRLVVAVIVVVAGELFNARTIYPIEHRDNMLLQIIVVQVFVRVLICVLMDHKWSKKTIGPL